MLDVEYLYLGGPYDGQWRRPANGMTPGKPEPERYANGEDNAIAMGRYVPTKFGHMAGFGEGQFRMSAVIMLDEPWADLLRDKSALAGENLRYAQRLERALVHQVFREHLRRTWRAPEVLEFGAPWHVMERRPAQPRTRPIRDNPQA